MKKMLVCLGIAAALAVHADYLYWMTDDYTKELDTGSYAQLYYTTGYTPGQATTGSLVERSREYYYANPDVKYIEGVTDLSVLAGLKPEDTFFYVEIFGADGAQLYSGLDYGTVAKYSELSASIRAFDDLTNVSSWHAAAPIPEPTGGVLLLLGLSALALRRKESV